MADLDEYLAPPYADYYKIQQGKFSSIIFNIYIHIRIKKKKKSFFKPFGSVFG